MDLLKKIPKVDKLASNKAFNGYSINLITKITKKYLDILREKILKNDITEINLDVIIKDIKNQYENITSSSLKNVINATGIIVHTNLGRSLIDEDAIEAIKPLITNYNNLEYDIEKGKRGERYTHVSSILKELIGCEDAIVVNNNASAVFLILNTFAKKKEVVVSRGELVEIGGSFRVPEVMSESGAKLKEIGTTNKTHVRDYVNAIGKKTAMLMKVHKSNYSIEGFSSDVSFKEISEIAKENDLIDYYDMGSGHIIDLPYGLNKDEPSLLELMKFNPSLISFSGDKLLGSVQAGIIVGKKELIDKLKKNQLLRMLRVDKITLALLEENLKSMLKQEYEKIPTLKFLLEDLSVLEKRAKNLQSILDSKYNTTVIKTKTFVGGGTTPNKKIPTVAITLKLKGLSCDSLAKKLRDKNLITRIENDTVLIDFRTVREFEIEKINNILNNLI